MTGLALLAALVGVLAAVAFYMQSRTIRAEADARAAEVERARTEAAAAQKAMADQKGELKERREEATGLKLKLDEARKKAFEQAELQKKLGGAAGLREELEKVTTRLAEARAEAAHQVEVAKGQVELAKAAEAARAKAVGEAERLKAALDRKLAEPPPVAPAAPIPPDVAEVQAKVAVEADRAEKAEARATELRKKLSEAEKELKVQKGRIETERRVYMVTKGEVDLSHDRYAELKRRHDALRKEHDELIEAVRQAAREERRQTDGSRAAQVLAETRRAAVAEAPTAEQEPAEASVAAEAKPAEGGPS